MSGELQLTFCEATVHVEPGDELTFGRAAQLVLDPDNRFMHRRVGSVVHRHGRWWLVNRGDRLNLSVWTTSSAHRSVLPPGADCVLPSGTCVIGFVAGPTRYELEAAVKGADAADDALLPVRDGDPTDQWGAVELNDEQRQLLVALCERDLRDPSCRGTELPPNRAVAHRLGWTITKYNRKLDHLCAKFARSGVRGVQGSIAGLASDRRQRLVAHCIEHGIITIDDLEHGV